VIGVRELELADLPDVTELARIMHGEAPNYRDFPFDELRLQDWFGLFLKEKNWLCILAVDEQHGPIGMLAVAMLPMIFCYEQQIDDVAFFVHPDWRGTTAAIRMIRYLETWAKANGAAQIRIGLTTGTNEAQSIRFLERFGFHRTGSLMSR
jgi:GNAT superfamily N-acetyltransferase